MIRWLLVLAVLAAGVAYATKPGIKEFDDLLRTQIERRIATTDIGTDGDAVETIALVGCKLRPSDCFNLIRQGIEVEVEDRVLFTRFSVTGLRKDATCTGVFTTILCSETMMEQ